MVAPKRQEQVKVILQLDLLASDRAHRREVVAVKVVMILVRVAAGTWNRLGGQAAAAKEGRGRRGDLRVGAAATRSGHSGVDARHAEAVRTRECRGKAVAVVVFRRSRGLAMGWLLSVPKIRREAVDFLFAAA
jgi:hypothetical protein